jgi:hypothetical protein
MSWARRLERSLEVRIAMWLLEIILGLIGKHKFQH